LMPSRARWTMTKCAGCQTSTRTTAGPLRSRPLRVRRFAEQQTCAVVAD
jgi:hypothetical protein